MVIDYITVNNVTNNNPNLVPVQNSFIYMLPLKYSELILDFHSRYYWYQVALDEVEIIGFYKNPLAYLNMI
jgi:hypothetical protein